MLLIGYLYQETHDVPAARKAFEDTIRISHPLRTPAASVALADIKLREGDAAGAAADFQRALDMSPKPQDKGSASLLLGIARKRVGDRAGALDAFRRAKTLGSPEVAKEAADELIRLAAPLSAEDRAARAANQPVKPAGMFGKAERAITCPLCEEELSKSGNFAHWDTHVMQFPPGSGEASGLRGRGPGQLWAVRLRHERAPGRPPRCQCPKMAAAVRGGDVKGVIFHSDRGSEYSAGHFRAACEALGVRQSMSRVGSPLDNAAAESFFSTLEFEYLRKHRFATKAGGHASRCPLHRPRQPHPTSQLLRAEVRNRLRGEPGRRGGLGGVQRGGSVKASPSKPPTARAPTTTAS